MLKGQLEWLGQRGRGRRQENGTSIDLVKLSIIHIDVGVERELDIGVKSNNIQAKLGTDFELLGDCLGRLKRVFSDAPAYAGEYNA